MKSQSGFTLIELVVALAIIVVITGLVIVRVDGWSSRQALHASARALGNAIRLYREKAQEDEETCTLRLELDRATYSVTAAGQTLRRGKLGVGQSFGKAYAGEDEVSTPVILNLGPRGLVPEVTIAIENSAGEKVTLKVSAMANEVTYAEAK
jgi:prepilin-type N-terminal cleavage/methylation domain-containing protein